MKLRNTISILLCLNAGIANAAPKKADIIIYAQKVYTVDPTFSVTEGVVINNGKIVFTGSKEIITAIYSSDNILNVSGYVYPGFIDAHCHFSNYALDAYKCDLVSTSSFADVLERLTAYEKENKLGWIYGRGWDQNDWTEKEFPDKSAIDSLFPNKPVILKRVDGHAILANQKALDMAHITTSTKIRGGIIEKKNGRLTGILIDNAMEPVEDLIPSLPESTASNYFKAMELRCFSEGLTGVVDCGVKKEIISQLEKLYEKNKLSIGNTILLADDKKTLDAYLLQGPLKKGQFRLTGIKQYADGALGSRGACLLKEYSDKPGFFGMLTATPQEMSTLATKALKYNWQLCTHAIGDSANRTVLNLYGSFLNGKNDKRWRIEHAQVVELQDINLFSKYSVIPSVQPTHAISDMPWAETRLGKERMPEAYAYRQLMEQNGWIALGTDFPVEAINPLATFYTAVVRKDKDGNPVTGFLPGNTLSRKDALKGMTLWAAKSVFWEKEKGSIEPGKDADLVILEQDIMTIPEDQLLNTTVLCTIVKGKIVYKK